MDYLLSITDQLAPQLRSLRKARGLSQAQLACELRVTQSRVAAIERNPAAVSVGQLIRILGVLGAGLVLRDTTLASATDPARPVSPPTKLGQPAVSPKGEW